MSENLERLSILEQNLSTIISQKQQYNKQLMEIESAFTELKTTNEAFKIVGTIMIKKSSDSIKKDLEERKSLVKARLDSLDKQEIQLRKQVEELQSIVMKELDQE